MRPTTQKGVYGGSIVLFVLLLVWGMWLQYLPEHTTVWNYAYNLGYALLYLIGAVIGLVGAFLVTTRISMGKALLYLGLAQLSYVFALLIWAYDNLILQISIPYPSIADVFFILFYPLLAIGCWHFLTMVVTHIHTQYLFEVLGIFFLSAIVIVGFLSTPDITGEIPILTKIVNIWYPLGDSLLIAISYLVVRASKGVFQSGVLILVLGLLIQVFADIIFSFRTNTMVYWNGDISDILFGISGFTLSLGIINIFYNFISPSAPRDAS